MDALSHSAAPRLMRPVARAGEAEEVMAAAFMKESSPAKRKGFAFADCAPVLLLTQIRCVKIEP